MPGEMLPFIGLAAKQAREAAGVSQEEMARHLGMDRGAAGAFEGGKRWPRSPDRTVSIYANVVGLRPVDLWARAVALLLAAEPDPASWGEWRD